MKPEYPNSNPNSPHYLKTPLQQEAQSAHQKDPLKELTPEEVLGASGVFIVQAITILVILAVVSFLMMRSGLFVSMLDHDLSPLSNLDKETKQALISIAKNDNLLTGMIGLGAILCEVGSLISKEKS